MADQTDLKQHSSTRTVKVVDQEPWNEGYDAASRGCSELDNPYDRKSNLHKYMRWRSGWYDYTYQSQEDNYCGGY